MPELARDQSSQRNLILYAESRYGTEELWTGGPGLAAPTNRDVGSNGESGYSAASAVDAVNVLGDEDRIDLTERGCCPAKSRCINLQSC